MDVLSDLEDKADPGENTHQSALFSREVAEGEADIAPQATGDDPASNGGSSCTYCGRRVDTDDDTTYKEVRTWISGPKKDSAVLRTYTGRYSCGDCITKLRSGIAPDQPELEALLGAIPATSSVGEILTDRSAAYNSGYRDGVEGRPGDAARLHLIGNDVYDYAEGYEVGSERRASEEWSGSSREPGEPGGGIVDIVYDELPF